MGNPLERDLADVAADLRAEIVSREAAHRDYGAVSDEAGAIDVEASRRLRAERARAAKGSDAVRDHQDA
jgi:N-methylhydantoinase B/oxoprolinase/acetone carboxylase alpha subunit